jgi:hypothetical protein
VVLVDPKRIPISIMMGGIIINPQMIEEDRDPTIAINLEVSLLYKIIEELSDFQIMSKTSETLCMNKESS